jgi:cell wall-associated NlpC family hydrolase
MEDAVERYNYACTKLENTRSEIEENKEKLNEAEQELAANKARLNSRVRAMYVNQRSNFVEVVVNAGDFDTFLVGLDLVKRVGQKDANLVRQVKDAKAKLEQARASLQEQKSAQEAAKQEIAAAKSNVEGELSNVEAEIRAAMSRRASEASSSSSSYSRASYDPTARRSRPPGAPNGGVVGVAYDQLGKPYVWGAAGPNSFDCSGLTMYCYRVGAGISISHSSYAQAYCGVPVSVGELAAGDILGFRGWGHVGLYIGGGEFIHAPQSGDVVKITSLASRSNFCGAVRP